MIKSISHKIAEEIYENVEDASPVSVLEYALHIVLNYVVVVIATILFCSFTGHVWEAIVACVVFPVIRQFSGGLHLKTSLRCNVFSVCMMLCAVYFSLLFSFFYTGLIIMIVTLLVIYIHAPNNIRGSLHPKYYSLLNWIAIFIISTNFVIQSTLLVSIFFIQSLLITTTANFIVNKYDL
ncbi:accessory gene regulator B family protein [Longirhabdus pacifica]|uniref:accessory gene regulator B family protein n=1 Tax=Longirhabdus pacifica TaxID=2305227 RepID=UPI001008F48E|nr:accessory gene regulator B family protein [Longirhabdus pacifica]